MVTFTSYNWWDDTNWTLVVLRSLSLAPFLQAVNNRCRFFQACEFQWIKMRLQGLKNWFVLIALVFAHWWKVTQNMGKLSIIKIFGHVLHSSLFVVEGPLKPGILQRIFRSVQFLPEPRNHSVWNSCKPAGWSFKLQPVHSFWKGIASHHFMKNRCVGECGGKIIETPNGAAAEICLSNLDDDTRCSGSKATSTKESWLFMGLHPRHGFPSCNCTNKPCCPAGYRRNTGIWPQFRNSTMISISIFRYHMVPEATWD